MDSTWINQPDRQGLCREVRPTDINLFDVNVLGDYLHGETSLISCGAGIAM